MERGKEAIIIVRQVVKYYWTICHYHFTIFLMYVCCIIDTNRNQGETNDDQ
ncbi:hypothetical protein ORL59_28155 [Bacillus cereus]|uniref:hypothetical protein n=1 Tax=Bacillus cereus TaxID=1396 RepID=UPI002AC03286|nr:hypothetical protein [Bacillus cereus]MDZ4417372.1 hypothetical protein [Bacillus cereus]